MSLQAVEDGGNPNRFDGSSLLSEGDTVKETNEVSCLYEAHVFVCQNRAFLTLFLYVSS